MKPMMKFVFWATLVVVMVAVIFFTPVASKQAVLDTIDSWVEQYSDAVESAQSDDDDDESLVDLDSSAGELIVRLEEEARDYAGVVVMPLEESTYFAEIKAQAKVVNLQPILQLRSRYNQAVSELEVAKVVERAAREELNRLKQLSQGVAAKKINYAQSQWQQQNAQLKGLRFQVEDIKNEARQQWGEIIAGWVMKDKSKSINRLLSRQDSLLLVTLPVSHSLAGDVSFIHISRKGSRKNARKAYYISPAWMTDQMIQGETYFFKTATGKLRTGMRINAWLPEGNEPLSGIRVPDQAIVWYGGQPWAYVQLDEGVYQRRSLKSGLVSPDSLFFTEGFFVGEQLVVSGAQMLLSEEFRWQIQDEDDD